MIFIVFSLAYDIKKPVDKDLTGFKKANNSLINLIF